MGQCPQCGYSGSGNFCPDCGVEMVIACWRCGEPRPVRAKFCSQCSAPSQPPATPGTGSGSGVSGSNVKIGDIGVLRGTIDASTHVSTSIGSQTNISGPVHVHYTGKREPTAEEWLERGLTALRGRQYDAAIDAFRQLLKLRPDSTDGYFYLAIALLKGHRPKLVSLATVRDVESQLRAAVELDAACSHAYLLWALVKQDAYVLNSIWDRPPTVAQLLRDARMLDRRRVQEVIEHVVAPGNEVWERARAALK